MPRMIPRHEEHPGVGRARRPPAPGPSAGEEWFWADCRTPSETEVSVGPVPARGEPTRRVEPTAAWSAVLGPVGVAALVLGELRHFGAPVDVVVALLALSGTVSAIVTGHAALGRIAHGVGRGRGPAFLGLAAAWLAVLLVLTTGLLRTAV